LYGGNGGGGGGGAKPKAEQSTLTEYVLPSPLQLEVLPFACHAVVCVEGQ